MVFICVCVCVCVCVWGGVICGVCVGVCACDTYIDNQKWVYSKYKDIISVTH